MIVRSSAVFETQVEHLYLLAGQNDTPTFNQLFKADRSDIIEACFLTGSPLPLVVYQNAKSQKALYARSDDYMTIAMPDMLASLLASFVSKHKSRWVQSLVDGIDTLHSGHFFLLMIYICRHKLHFI